MSKDSEPHLETMQALAVALKDPAYKLSSSQQEKIKASFEAIRMNLRKVINQTNPTYTFENGKIVLHGTSSWKDVIGEAKEILLTIAKSVGRIDINSEGKDEYAGTGWLIKSNIIITNNHVAEYLLDDFYGEKPTLKPALKARIDFNEEYGSIKQNEFSIKKVLHIDRNDDFALFQIQDCELPPIKLGGPAEQGEQVAVIGFPSDDPMLTREERDLFDSKLNVKSISPGTILIVTPSGTLLHDCTTVGGNSGSVLISLKTHRAIGLHYRGDSTANYAIPISRVESLLNDLRLSEREEK